MSVLSIDARLFRAAQQAYDVAETGAMEVKRPFDQIGWLAAPMGFAVSEQQTNAALIGETASETIVAFRGTLPPLLSSPNFRRVLLDWLNNFDALPVQDPHLPGRVHQGFAKALNALWPQVEPRLNSGKPLYFTGHSKGGALADLAAVRYVLSNPGAPAPKVITFAAAKPGDKAFRTAYEAAVLQSVRYENRVDIVPHVPPGDEFGGQFGALLEFGRALDDFAIDYRGVGTLKYIKADGAIVADSAELTEERLADLLKHAVTLNLVPLIADHLPGDTDGYGTAVLPPDMVIHLNQREPGMSPVVFGFRT